MSETKWYAVHTMSGKETMVKGRIDADLALSDSLFRPYVAQVLVPTEKKIKLSADGKKKIEKDMLLFPGYIFIEAIFSKELPSLLRDNITEILGFVGTDSVNKEPLSLTPAEVRRLKGYQGDLTQLEGNGLSFAVKEKVKVVVDPFNGFQGTVVEVNEEQKKLKVLVTIFGRDTSVELGFTQVEKE